MKRTSSNVTVGKRQLELSNLNKVLFPESGIVKAQLIQYYLSIAPTILRHIKGRPLSLVRYPDGVDGESFFQKNLPDWTPRWIERVALGDSEKIEYALATEEATLAWLANLACIELHQVHSRIPKLANPDYIVWDLDPPEGYPFTDIVNLAFRLRDLVESYGYHPFVKTTGGKGVHLVAPIEPLWTFDQGRDAALEVAKEFIASRPRETTLLIKKDARAGKVFIDVYRNRPYQTIVSPYSVRGRGRAPVSMPVTWDVLADTSNPNEYNLLSAPEILAREGDPWEAIGAYAVALHQFRDRSPASSPEDSGDSEMPASSPGLAPSGSESLDEYARKRKFDSTPEPGPEPGATPEGNSFVIHRHHATRLHYDLRIEQNGALKSFAIPKGLPARPGIKHLAVHTEDHPMKYLDFKGQIPKGQYGAGMMWIYARGKYDLTKEKKDGFYFRLRSRELNAEYRMIKTSDKEYLCERLERPQPDWLTEAVSPMLAETRDQPFDSDDYLYEVKWDGIRATISLDEGQLTIRSRSGRDITKQFPELNIPEQAFRASGALLDGEIVSLDEAGHPIFQNVIRRLQQTTGSGIERLRPKFPAVCYLFDCIYLDGRSIAAEPLTLRREWLEDLVRDNPVYRVSEAFDEGVSLFAAARRMGLEGIMAKVRTSPYLPGRRSPLWIKVKSHATQDCVIVGFTKGKGVREGQFGALHLGCYKDGTLQYVGKAGTGFDEELLTEVFAQLDQLERIERPVEKKPLDDSQSVWVKPELVCEVRYSSLTQDRQLREPVFLRMRPDLAPEACSLH